MKKSTLRNSFIVLLLISNGIFIFKWINGPERRHHGPRDEIIEKLHFDDAQVKQYDKLIHQHRNIIDNAERKLQHQKQQLYANLQAPFSDSILAQILATEAEIEHTHFNHFKDIEKLCKPDQMKYFKALNKEIASLFSPGKKLKR